MENNAASSEPKPGKVYSNESIKVFWNPELCIHSGNCVQGLPQVFQRDSRPWIKINAATAPEIAEAVTRCPSGALRYELANREEAKPEQAQTIIEPRPDGPLSIKGQIRIENPDGTVLFEGDRVSLCRCGNSGNKPFCDGTHRTIGFKS